MAMIGSLVEADAVCPGSCSDAARLVIGIQLEIPDEVAGVVVEVGEVLRSGLLQRDLYW